MAECFACRKHRSRAKEYFDLPICRKCYEKLGLGSQEITSIQDEFITQIVLEEDRQAIDRLISFASEFPRTISKDLLGICLANIHEEDMDGVVIGSFIISARAVLLFGTDAKGETDLDKDRIHFLISLATVIGVSIVASIAKGYKELGLDIEDDEIAADIGPESLMTFLSILNEIRRNDPKKELREEILGMFYEMTILEE